MSLSDLAAIGSFISGLAVLISLVFLYFQLRQVTAQVQQAERNQQASIGAGRAARTVAICMGLTEPSVAEAMLKGGAGSDDLTDTQLFQFRMGWNAFLYSFEDSYFQHKKGLLSDEAFAGVVAGWRRSLVLPGVRVFWSNNRIAFESGFVEFVDRLVRDAPVAPSTYNLDKWKADIAAELSTAVH